MPSLQLVPTQFQGQFNASGTKFVRVDYRVYSTGNPARYIACVKRNNTHRLFEHLYECDENGNKK
jgi:hypothetical protein